MALSLSLLKDDQRGRAINLMASAFASDPLFRATFKGSDQTRAFVAFMLDMNRLLGGQAIGAFEEGRLVGCVLIEAPAPARSITYMAKMAIVLIRFMPLALRLSVRSIATLNTYFVRTRAAPPSRLYAYLAMVGVAPEQQGRGMGRVLIKEAERRAGAWGADGIALDTENSANVPFYEKLGFKLGQQIDLQAFTSFCMYRMATP